MYEIELKAHVTDREKTIEKLNSFAEFSGNLERHDTYWTKNVNGKLITARIRHEIENGNEIFLLTYKRKQLITGANGETSEVNDENETALENRCALEILLEDLGFEITTKKDKIIKVWKFATEFGNATLELATVLPLGDFLEIEILSEKNDSELTAKIQAELYKILEKSGISKNQIENRYYSDMIKELGQK